MEPGPFVALFKEAPLLGLEGFDFILDPGVFGQGDAPVHGPGGGKPDGTGLLEGHRVEFVKLWLLPNIRNIPSLRNCVV